MIKFLIENIKYIETIALLVVAIGFLCGANIAIGIFYNVKRLKQEFNKEKLFDGIIKALIIIFVVVVATFAFLVFVYLKLFNKQITDPLIICYGAAVVYFVKVINGLAKIFGVQIEKIPPLPNAEKEIEDITSNVDPQTSQPREETNQESNTTELNTIETTEPSHSNPTSENLGFVVNLRKVE